MNKKRTVLKLVGFLAILMMCFALLISCNSSANEGETKTETQTDEQTESSKDSDAVSETEVVSETVTETVQETESETETETGTETETETEEETHGTMLYQLAPDDSSLTMCYVLKTPNDKLIVIDGGIDGIGRNKAPYLPAALRSILGLGEDDYFEVEAWFLSHAHSDHIYELSKMLRDYTPESNYKINNFYFDFPPFATAEYAGKNDDFFDTNLRENMNAYAKVVGAEVKEGMDFYDSVNGAVINEKAIKNGLEINIDGVRIEVLQTWNIADGFSNVNDTSIILRFWVEGQSIMFLGDAGPIAGIRLVKTYGDKLKSDIVQMAHHGQAGVDKNCYAAIDAQVYLWPTPVWVWKNENNYYQTNTTREWIYGENFLQADEYNIVAGLYKRYPTRSSVVSQWNKMLGFMSIELPYILPYRENSLHK